MRNKSEVLRVGNRNISRQGFTLTEAMVSIFISVLVFASAFPLISHSLSVMRSAANWKGALHDARTAIEYLRTQNFDAVELEEGTHSLLLEDYDVEFLYTITDDVGATDVKAIVVQTSWTNDLSKKENRVELSTIISGPLHN